MRPQNTALVVLLLGSLATGFGPFCTPAAARDPAAGTPAAGVPVAGRPLAEVLLELRSRGLRIVFTSNVVEPAMVVEAEPVATDPRLRLDEILAPNDLEARDGPGGTIVVVPASKGESVPAPHTIRGFVGSRPDAAPIAGAVISVLGLDPEAVSDESGRFSLPHSGSDAVTLEVRLRGFVVEQLPELVPAPDTSTEVTILLDPAPILEEEVVVTPSRVSLLREEPLARLNLDRQEILALPHLGGDLFRALSLLPGTSANDVSARFHVRGGRRDETQILLDGQELYEAYHLQDRDGAMSFIAPGTLGTADLSTGGFAARYGDRMSGVLDMTTVTPHGARRYRVGAGVFSAQAGGSGTFGEDRGTWLAEIRRGTTDFVGRLTGNEDPVFWDAFAKFDYRPGLRNTIRANVLLSSDELNFDQFIEEEEQKIFSTDYGSSYFWVTHQTLVGPRLFFETAVSLTDIDRDRRGFEIDGDARFDIRDQRDSEIIDLRQKWSFQAGAQHALDWGWQVRRFDTEYDYFGMRAFDNPLAEIRHDSTEGTTEFRGAFRENQQSFHFADRFQIGEALTLQLGFRYDVHSRTDESHLSPRLNLARALGKRGVFRIAWGRFNQSQRPYELAVEDGEEVFQAVERSEHRVIGFEKLFDRKGTRSDLVFRVEAYQREVGNPRRRYENLYEPINTFPEVEPDRVRIVPEKSLAQGVELFLRGSAGAKVGWWVNYTFSSTEDRIDGHWIPRSIDQTHNLNLDLDYRINAHWRANFAWRYHTGWPTTPLSFEEEVDDEGEVEFSAILGGLNSDRLSSYHRLDLRASRRWRLSSSNIVFFLDIQNVYDRGNAAGFDFEFVEEESLIHVNREVWAGWLPSAGITFEF